MLCIQLPLAGRVNVDITVKSECEGLQIPNLMASVTNHNLTNAGLLFISYVSLMADAEISLCTFFFLSALF